MSIEALVVRIPPYAQDLARNLTVIAGETTLTEQQRWGAMLACAHAVGVGDVMRAIADSAPLSQEAAMAAMTASALMGMNNVYYRSLHLMQNKEYEMMRSGLRMNLLTNPGVDKIDFELWCLAVSAVNGCGLCLDSHEGVLRDHGVTALQVQTTLRIAAVINAVCAVIRAENAATAS